MSLDDLSKEDLLEIITSQEEIIRSQQETINQLLAERNQATSVGELNQLTQSPQKKQRGRPKKPKGLMDIYRQCCISTPTHRGSPHNIPDYMIPFIYDWACRTVMNFRESGDNKSGLEKAVEVMIEEIVRTWKKDNLKTLSLDSTRKKRATIRQWTTTLKEYRRKAGRQPIEM